MLVTSEGPHLVGNKPKNKNQLLTEEFDSGLYKTRPSVEVGSSKQAVSKIAQGQKLIGTSDCSGKQ